jgi:AAA domain-containing protein
MSRDVTSKPPEAPAAPPAIGNMGALMQAEFPAPQWVIPGLIQPGLTVLAGKPKIGKSWLGLDMCVAVAGGGLLLGQTHAAPGRALYLALEDTERRLQERAGKLLAALAPEQRAAALTRLDYACVWPALPEGGTEALAVYLRDHPDTTLVVIDTLAQVAPPRRAYADRYEHDYAVMRGLKRLADRHGTAIVAITHATKLTAEGDAFDEVSGSVGITGAADTGIVLRFDEARPGPPRPGAARPVQLVVRGRDVEMNTIALCFNPDTCRWGLAAHDKWGMLTAELRDVAVLLERRGALMPKDVATALHIHVPAAQGRLGNLKRRGVVSNTQYGKYDLADGYRDGAGGVASPPRPRVTTAAAAFADDDDDEDEESEDDGEEMLAA